ncbi:MlaD family protein [Nocardioides nanhaiensis]|uniref:MlaD family protein n=1 Tax=Nocardioides nanhaiensis TaxID=1476871 RepID=A0ABP8WHA3_9ACTN
MSRSVRTPLSARDPFKVGLVAIVLAGLVAGLVVLLSVVSFGTGTYTAVIAHTAGLRPGEDVQVHGVPVGEVRSVELRDTDVLVTFTVEEGIELGEGSRAAVKVATLLGTHYLEVDPVGGGQLADGRIPLERTSVPYNLQDVLEGGTRRLEELDAPRLARALTAASRTLAAAGDDVGPALDGVARLSELVAARSGQTGELLRAAEQVSLRLHESDADITGLMEQATLVVREVTVRRQAIRRLLDQTTGLAEALTAIVTETRADVAPALRDLDLALDALNAQDASLERVLDVMAPALRYVANATGNGPFLDLYVDDPAIPADDSLCQLQGGCR